MPGDDDDDDVENDNVEDVDVDNDDGDAGGVAEGRLQQRHRSLHNGENSHNNQHSHGVSPPKLLKFKSLASNVGQSVSPVIYSLLKLLVASVTNLLRLIYKLHFSSCFPKLPLIIMIDNAELRWTIRFSPSV